MRSEGVRNLRVERSERIVGEPEMVRGLCRGGRRGFVAVKIEIEERS